MVLTKKWWHVERQEDVFPQWIHSSQSLAAWWKAKEYDSKAGEEMLCSSAGNQFSSEELQTQLSEARSYECSWIPTRKSVEKERTLTNSS